jgi:transposase InsO family protein
MRWLFAGAWVLFMPRLQLITEIACLRQQLAVLQRQRPHSRLKNLDRRFWILMCRGFSKWRECLLIVTPGTVLHWHRKGWRHYWRLKSKPRCAGRRRIALELRELIRHMARDNPLWGQVRIMAELLKLGVVVSPRTIRRYMRRPYTGMPSPRWREFLKLHAKDIWACDFLAVRTLTFQTLYVFFLIHLATRAIVHVRVTRHPTAAWTGQQVVNACFDRAPPRFLIRDRDSIFGETFSRRAKSLGIREIRTPVRAPKANAIAERFVGTLRRECLDHVFIFNERHLQKVAAEFAHYYNRHRPHRSLDHRPPRPAPVVVSSNPTGPPSEIIAEPVLGGLHHVYRKAA